MYSNMAFPEVCSLNKILSKVRLFIVLKDGEKILDARIILLCHSYY